MPPFAQRLRALPKWAEGLPAEPLMAFLLVGSWAPAMLGDQAAIAELGSHPGAVTALCIELVDQLPPQVRRLASGRRQRLGQPSEQFSWTDQKLAWEQLACCLNDQAISRFAAVVRRVLLPAQESSEGDRAASISEGLAAGLTLSLALLGNSDGLLPISPSPSVQAAAIVADLLQVERAWERLNACLPLLAEAAPESFLSSLGRALRESSASKTSVGPQDQTGLATALAILAWFEDLLEPVVLALATLVESGRDALAQDKKSPSLERLTDVFDVQDAHTNAAIEQRLNLLRNLTQSHPVTAWRLLIALLPVPVKDWSSYSAPQVLRVALPPRDRPAYGGEVHEQLVTIVDLVCGLSSSDSSRWAELIRAMTALPQRHIMAVLLRLEDSLQQCADSQGEIWSALRHFLSTQRDRGEAVAKASALYQQLTPQDPVLRWGWLFSVHHELPEYYSSPQEEDRELERLRMQALEELGQSSDRWLLLGKLAESAAAPWIFAGLLTKASWAAAVEQQLRSASSFGPIASIAPNFLARRLYGRDFADTEALLVEWMAAGRENDVLHVALSLSGSADARESLLWDLVERFGEPLLGQYWQAVADQDVLSHSAERRTLDETERTVRRLMQYGRAVYALSVAATSGKALPKSLVLDLLEQAADQKLQKLQTQDLAPAGGLFRPSPPGEWMLHENFIRCLAELTPASQEEETRLQAIELKLLSVLRHTSYRLRFLPKRIARDPEVLILLAGRNLSSHLTDLWQGYPGQELPAPEGQNVLFDWSSGVLQRLPENGMARHRTLSALSTVLVRPLGTDGVWPGEATRRLLRNSPSEELTGHLEAALCNAQRSQRARPVAEMAQRAAQRAAQYREYANRLQVEWPETALLLRQAASFFEAEVERNRRDDERDGWSQPMTSEQPATQPLFPLSHVRVSGFRIIKEFEQDLHPRLNVVLGRNASGKTSLLDAIAIGLSALARRLPRTGPDPERELKFVKETDRWEGGSDKRPERAKVVRVSLWARAVDAQADPLHWLVESRYARGPEVGDRENPQLQPYLDDLNEALRTSQSHIPMPVFAYYGVERAMSAAVDAAPPERALLRTGGLEGALQGAARFERTARWFRGLEDQEVRRRLQTPDYELPELHAVRSAVKAAVQDESGAKVNEMWVVPERNKLRVKFVRPDGTSQELDVTQLSDGFRTHLALVMDLALRMAIANPVPEGAHSLDGFGIQSHAVVLIDEVDQHLHPGWQKTVLPGLLDAFPRAQFIVTTHSVLTLGSVQDAQVFLMKDGQTECLSAPYGKDASLILRELLGIVPRAREIDERLSAIKDLLEQRAFPAARSQTDELEALLGSDDPDIQTLRSLLFFMDPRKPSASGGGGSPSDGRV